MMKRQRARSPRVARWCDDAALKGLKYTASRSGGGARSRGDGGGGGVRTSRGGGKGGEGSSGTSKAAARKFLSHEERRALDRASVTEKRGARGAERFPEAIQDAYAALAAGENHTTPPLPQAMRRVVAHLARLFCFGLVERGSGAKRALVLTALAGKVPNADQVAAAAVVLAKWQAAATGTTSATLLAAADERRRERNAASRAAAAERVGDGEGGTRRRVPRRVKHTSTDVAGLGRAILFVPATVPLPCTAATAAGAGGVFLVDGRHLPREEVFALAVTAAPPAAAAASPATSRTSEVHDDTGAGAAVAGDEVALRTIEQPLATDAALLLLPHRLGGEGTSDASDGERDHDAAGAGSDAAAAGAGEAVDSGSDDAGGAGGSDSDSDAGGDGYDGDAHVGLGWASATDVDPSDSDSESESGDDADTDSGSESSGTPGAGVALSPPVVGAVTAAAGPAASPYAHLPAASLFVPLQLRGPWEHHTRGIGSRVMSKHGYAGGVLGPRRATPSIPAATTAAAAPATVMDAAESARPGHRSTRGEGSGGRGAQGTKRRQRGIVERPMATFIDSEGRLRTVDGRVVVEVAPGASMPEPLAERVEQWQGRRGFGSLKGPVAGAGAGAAAPTSTLLGSSATPAPASGGSR